MAINFTPNLALAKPDAGTKPWWAEDHERQDILDDAVAGFLSKSVAGGVDVTLTTAEAWHHGIVFTGAISANIAVIVPTKQRHYRVRNDTTGAFILTVKTTAGAGIAIGKGEVVELTCDGTDVIRMERKGFSGATAGGTTAYTLTPVPALPAYETNQIFFGNWNATNTGASTLNISSLGAKTIKRFVAGAKADVAAGDLVIGQPWAAWYDGTDLVLLTPVGSAVASALGQGLHTIWVPAGAMVPRTTNGAAFGTVELATNDVMLKTLDFDASTSEGAQFSVAMPKSWDEGTVTAIFYWTAASGSGTVTFALAGLARSDDDALDTAFGTAIGVTDTLLLANDLHISPTTAAITIGGTPAENDLVFFQVTRDIADTLAVDAKLIGVKLLVNLNAATDA